MGTMVPALPGPQCESRVVEVVSSYGKQRLRITPTTHDDSMRNDCAARLLEKPAGELIGACHVDDIAGILLCDLIAPRWGSYILSICYICKV